MAKVVLDFERPILELEKKIDEMRKYADNLDIAEEITTLEKKVDTLRESIFSNLGVADLRRDDQCRPQESEVRLSADGYPVS